MTPVADLTSLAGRAALVTGGSRGIGRAIAAELLARGAAVTITGRKPDELAAAVAELAAGPAGGDAARVLGVPGNAADPAARAEAVDATVAAFGGLAVLVNNAGVNPQFGPLVDADLDAVRKVFDVNVVAALGFVQLAHRAWMGEHGGAVVNIASVAGLRSTHDIGAYGASKAALIRLTEELAWQLGPRIRVNAVAPAVVKTRFSSALYAGREEQVAAAYPLHRLGTPGGRGGAGRVPGVGRGVVDHRRDGAGGRRAAGHRRAGLTRPRRRRSRRSRVGCGFADHDLDGQGAAGGLVEHGPARLGDVEDPRLGAGEQGGEPAVGAQVVERRGVAAEHDRVQRVRDREQDPGDGVRRGVESDPGLVVAPPREPPGRRPALPVAPVHQPRPRRGRLDHAAHRDADAVAAEPDEHDPDPARDREMRVQGVEHRTGIRGTRTIWMQMVSIHPRPWTICIHIVRAGRRDVQECARQTACPARLGRQPAERHHDLGGRPVGGPEPQSTRCAVDATRSPCRSVNRTNQPARRSGSTSTARPPPATSRVRATRAP